MKKILKIFKSAFLILFIVVFLIILFFWYMFGGGSYFIKIPKPEITYGEFPFQLIYELDGETKKIEDIIICQFDGYSQRTEAGQHRKWKMTVKSTGKDMITLCDLRDNNDYTEWGNQVLELCFDPGSGEYYMGDVGERQSRGSMGKWIDYLYISKNGKIGYSAFELDEAYEKYKIKLISWEIAPPIENTFK